MASAEASAGGMTFKVVKTNKRGKSQNRVLELNFTDGIIKNLNAKGKVQKSHHASKVMFAEKVSDTMLVLHLPDKKDYKLNFLDATDRDMFCAKLVDLCKTCKVNTAEPLDEVMFDPTKHATFGGEGDGKESFTFRVKATSGNGQFLEDIILFIGKDGIAVCDISASADEAEGGALNHKVRAFYPYAHVRSWENHGEMVIIEVARKKADGSGVHQEVVKVKGDDATCNAILKAIHTCISNLMERKKAEKAEKAAAAAAGAAAAIAQQAAPAAPSPAPPPVSQAERFRRASLVVDVAAMATFTEDGAEVQTGPLGKPVETFASRRQSVLAATNRRASLIGGIGNVMAGLGGGGSEADMMAAAVAAIDMEDNFDDAGISGAKVMADVVGVLTDTADIDEASEEGIRRMSLMADVSGEAMPAQGSERERRASMLLDLAAFIEEGEDETGEGFEEASTTTFDTIVEDDEDEEEDDFDDLGDGGGVDDMDDFDMLGVPEGDTSVI